MVDLIKAREEYGELLDIELELEARYKKIAELAAEKNLMQNLNAEDGVAHSTLGQKFIAQSVEAVMHSFVVYLEDIQKRVGKAKPAYYDIIIEILDVYKGDINKVASLFAFTGTSIMFEIMTKSKIYLSNISQYIIKEIFDEVRLQAYMNQITEEGKVKRFIAGIDERVQKHYRRAYATARMSYDSFVYPKWNNELGVSLGATIIEIIICSCDYFEYCKVENLLAIMPTQKLLDAWNKNKENLIGRSYKFCPMVIPPRDWEDNYNGGYYGELIGHGTFLRLKSFRDIYAKNYIRKIDQLELAEVRKAVNSVQATPWRINKKVLEVMKLLISRGGGIAGLPLVDTKPKPAPLPEDADDKAKEEYKKAMVAYYKGEVRRKSIVLKAMSTIRMADDYKDFEKIYFPHNLDFRGRVYPIVSILSPQGDTLSKALLEFAGAPACERKGDWQWLCVEGANLAGVDKVSYDDRVQWVLDNELQILASAEDPLSETFWQDVDCPFEFLGWCFEYARAVEHIRKYGSIIGFVCGLNIAFDGTCSGLQHFSAILRDPIGGKAVNLVPGDKPSDIYAIVAEKVNAKAKEDALYGTDNEDVVTKKGSIYTKLGTKAIAQIWLAKGITRKITKRSVMTLAYGSKTYGFCQNLLHDIIKPDIDENDKYSVFYGYEETCANYLSKLIWEAVGTTVVAAVEGMKWLQECAKLVTKDNQVVCWTTTMGLPVQQAYMEYEPVTIRLRCAGKIVRLYTYKNKGNIDNRAQAQGVAPNFIHSCDAAHLQLTICNCVDAGIKHFAMIHDSYGAPLAQAQDMYKIVRESFIQMYTENDVLENFRKDMQALTEKELPPLPKKSTLDLTVIRDSKYIFS